MSERLCSVGLDVGTTTTQLIVSELTVENRASGFAVPQMEITRRQIRYQSPIYLTPLQTGDLVHGEAIRKIVETEYEKAGVTPADVDSGAVIITGETSRKENARQVLDALSGFAGEFVVATAGPHLESVLAAKGAGAAEYSRETGKRVLHMDIGGGTSNLALLEDGKLLRTGCMNVGGRLLKVDTQQKITYISPVVEKLTDLRVGETADLEKVRALAKILVQGLEMAAGFREKTGLWEKLVTTEATDTAPVEKVDTVSFSGGVADCIETEHPPFTFGDIGPVLGQTIRGSRLCQGNYILGSQTIRATVIGAGCHSTMLSGSTVFFRGVQLPVKNLAVAVLGKEEQYDDRAIRQKLEQFDEKTVALAMPGEKRPTYEQVKRLAEAVAKGCEGRAVYVCLEGDMAKALGHYLCLLLPETTPCLCIDRVRLQAHSFLDVGCPVGPALPVVVKTLILGGTL